MRVLRSRMKSEQFQNLKHNLQNYEQPQHGRIEQNLGKINQQSSSQPKVIDNHSSYAYWQIQNADHFNQVSQFDSLSHYNKPQYPHQISHSDTKSIQSSTQHIAKNRMVKNLCRAVQILRNKMPERSLQQIIIRLQQAARIKRDLSNQGELLSDYMNEYNSVNNINAKQDEEPSQIKKQDEEPSQIKKQDEEPSQTKKQADQPSNWTDRKQILLAENLNHEKNVCSPKVYEFNPDSRFQLCDKQINEKKPSFQKKTNFQQSNYIYRPKGQQIIMQFLLKDTLKTKFVNIEEQTRYKFQKVVAEALVGRGYGVGPCRKEIQAQKIDFVMKRNNYKKISISVATFAFRRLESFLTTQCQKKLKFIDRHQMQVISIIVLNCRLKMQPQHVSTMFKYVKACYGIEDVLIGEIQSVKLYLTFQRYLYGKNVTMQFLERIGQIQHKKQVEQTLVYINNRSRRYQQRLITLRRRREQKNMGVLSNKEYNNKPINNKYRRVQVNMDEVKVQPAQNHNMQKSNSHEGQTKQQEQQQKYIAFQAQLAKQNINHRQFTLNIDKAELNHQLQRQESKSVQDRRQIQMAISEPYQNLQLLSCETQNDHEYGQDIWSSQSMFENNNFDVQLQKLKIDTQQPFDETGCYNELEEGYTDELISYPHEYQYKVDDYLDV